MKSYEKSAFKNFRWQTALSIKAFLGSLTSAGNKSLAHTFLNSGGIKLCRGIAGGGDPALRRIWAMRTARGWWLLVPGQIYLHLICKTFTRLRQWIFPTSKRSSYCAKSVQLVKVMKTKFFVQMKPTLANCWVTITQFLSKELKLMNACKNIPNSDFGGDAEILGPT